MKSLVISVVTGLTSTATLAGLVVALADGQVTGWWLVALVVAVGVGLVPPLVEVAAYRRTRPRHFKSDDEIKRFMLKWIGAAGHAFVCTRNMSWADDEESRELLRAKARAGDLSLVIPQPLPLATELAQLGASVHVYPNAGWAATTRFTITRYGRADAEVAVGMRIGGDHQIVTFRPGRDHAFGLAEDLANALQRLA